MCFCITTSDPDTVLICCRAGTRPVIDLDLFYAPVRPHAKTERPPSRAFFMMQTQGCRRGKCECRWAGVGKAPCNSWSELSVGSGVVSFGEVEGRRGDSWRQDRASRSGRMTITKILAGSHGPTERGCSWLTQAHSYRMGRQVDERGGVCVYLCVSERKRDAPTSTSCEIAPSCH